MVSAVTGEGVDTLLAAIEARISGELTTRTVLLDAQHLTIMSWIYDRGRVKDRTDHEDGSVEITAEFTASDSLDLDRQLGLGAQAGYGFRRLTSAGRFRGARHFPCIVDRGWPRPLPLRLMRGTVGGAFHAIPNFPKTSGFCSETGSQARRCPGCGYGVFATPDRVFARHASGWIEIFRHI